MSLVFALGECPACGGEFAGLTHGCEACGWTPENDNDDDSEAIQ